MQTKTLATILITAVIAFVAATIAFHYLRPMFSTPPVVVTPPVVQAPVAVPEPPPVIAAPTPLPDTSAVQVSPPAPVKVSHKTMRKTQSCSAGERAAFQVAYANAATANKLLGVARYATSGPLC